MKVTVNKDRLLAFFNTMSAEISLSHGDAAHSYAVNRQIMRMRKRAQLGDSDLLAKKAVDKFVSINDTVKVFSLSLDEDIVSNAREFIETALWRFTTKFSPDSIQESLDLRWLYDNWKFGPGASNGVTGTHACKKIVQPFTSTSQATRYVSWLRESNPYFRSYDGNGNGIVVTSGSRLTTVPKNEDTERTIAIEPLGNMALQLAAGTYLEGTLRMIGLDIKDQQPKNKAMARRGSIDGSLATIDLASASDSISIPLVRALFPKKWFELLMDLRSPVTTLPDGRVVEMHMMSTMGNGFTFPLMTFIFVSLIYALRCRRRGPRLFIDWSNTCVFGDDIIVPTREYEALCNILEKAGFSVNKEKSFSSGPFRESCGGDYFEGHDVTPFYVKSLRNDSEIYVAINQLLKWSGTHKVCVTSSLRLLVSYLKRGPYLVPEWMDPSEGILTSQCPRRYKYLSAKPIPSEHKRGHFDMMLAVGGYITEDRSGVFFTERSAKVRLNTCKARLPNGYLDGWCPDRGSPSASSWVALMVSLIT